MSKNLNQERDQLAIAGDGAEAMRLAVLALLDGTDDMRRRGHDKSADTYDTIAARVRAIDLATVVTAATGLEATVDERVAFELAARAQHFNTLPKENGEYFHHITNRVRAVWNAAVRWSRAQRLNLERLPKYNGIQGEPCVRFADLEKLLGDPES